MTNSKKTFDVRTCAALLSDEIQKLYENKFIHHLQTSFPERKETGKIYRIQENPDDIACQRGLIIWQRYGQGNTLLISLTINMVEGAAQYVGDWKKLKDEFEDVKKPRFKDPAQLRLDLRIRNMDAFVRAIKLIQAIAPEISGI